MKHDEACQESRVHYSNHFRRPAAHTSEVRTTPSSRPAQCGRLQVRAKNEFGEGKSEEEPRMCELEGCETVCAYAKRRGFGRFWDLDLA